MALVLAGTGCDGDGAPPQDESAETLNGDGAQAPPSAESDCESEGACAQGQLCDVYECGGRPARFNHYGCARVPCEADTDCPTGEACFALAFDRSCEASVTACFEDAGACVCEASDDCDGVLDAHCLPTEFYPPQDYCNPAAFGCDALPDWLAALDAASLARTDTPLGVALASCADEAAAALEACP